MPPVPCPNGQKGFPWKRDCKSHFLNDGTLLTDASDPTATDKPLVNWGNFQMCRSSPPNIQISQQFQANNPFPNRGISGNYKDQHLEVHKWTCV